MKNAKVLSALGLMTLASTAALAASAAPTLGSVLDASGIKVSGNVAGSLHAIRQCACFELVTGYRYL